MIRKELNSKRVAKLFTPLLEEQLKKKGHEKILKEINMSEISKSFVREYFNRKPKILKPLKIQKIERFINELRHRIILAIKGFIIERELKHKIWELFMLGFNIAITGTLIHYAVYNRNWLSFGLISALVTYYLGWLIDRIKKRKEE